MTREEATERLKAILAEATADENAVCYVTSDDADALEIAIKALDQQPCEDCISRQAAIDAIWKPIIKPNEMIFDALKQAQQNEIETIPSVEPERKTGEWIDEQPWCLPKCSICGASCFGLHGFDAIKTPYCPTCGAKMTD